MSLNDVVNERWLRDNRFAKRLTIYGVALTPVLWVASYYASIPASQASFNNVWFGICSLTALVAAIGVTVGTGIGIGHVMTDEPPLPGDNR